MKYSVDVGGKFAYAYGLLTLSLRVPYLLYDVMFCQSSRTVFHGYDISLAFLAQSLLILFIPLNDGVYHVLIMNTILWVIAGGLLGMGIAYLKREKRSNEFYGSVIFGVLFIIISSYVIVPYIRSNVEEIRPLLFSLMSICGIGYMMLARKNHIYR